MGNPRHLQHMRRALFGALAAFALLSGCSEEGVTPNCPDLELYSIAEIAQNDGAVPPNIQSSLEQAAAADCITLPGDATSTGGAGGGPSTDDADTD